MKIRNLFIPLILLAISSNSYAALDLPKIKLELAKLEGSKDKKVGLAKCDELIKEIDIEMNSEKKNLAEVYTWKGIVVAKMAHYNKSLSLAKDAKSYLEKAIEIDEKNSDAAALNALGIMYHRVPRFISFGDDKKSEEYFKRAVQVSSNLDTNWRYGEFLLETGRKEQGLEHLKTALSQVNPAEEDKKIKAKIIQELIKKYE
jgi:tetratricopeptide (TPR) repeat protein